MDFLPLPVFLLSRRRAAAWLLAGLAAGSGVAAPAAPPAWSASWSAAPQDLGQVSAALGQPTPWWSDLSLRQRLPLSVGGAQLRVRFSNAFGRTTPLHIAAASVARSRGDERLQAASLRPLSFGGQPGVTVAPGAEVWSDPVPLPTRAGSELAVSFHFDRPMLPATVHGLGRQQTRVTPGNAVMAPQWPGAALSPWNHVVTGVDVTTGRPTRVLVAFGDSITEGGGLPGAPPQRYPDRLAERLAAAAPRAPRGAVSVLNAGISGNRLLADGVGPRALDRFQRDVLDQSGVTHTLILIGINDIGFLSLLEGQEGIPGMPRPAAAPTAPRIVAGLQQLVAQAQARGVKVLLGTLPPFKGSPYHGAATEAMRSAVNQWIRSQRSAEAVVDFDRALRDPHDPQALNPEYDSGDHLHPGAAGYAAMARAVDLNVLRR